MVIPYQWWWWCVCWGGGGVGGGVWHMCPPLDPPQVIKTVIPMMIIIKRISLLVDALSFISLQSVLHNWCKNGRGMCFPVSYTGHITGPLLLTGKSSA